MIFGKIIKRFQRRALNRYGLSASGMGVNQVKLNRLMELRTFRQAYVKAAAQNPGNPPQHGRGEAERLSVTICMVTHNSAADLETLSGLLSGVAPDVEGLKFSIVDNGSSDNTVELIENMMIKTSVPIELESGANVGFSKGANRCGAKAESEFLLFLNPDCAIDLETIRQLVSSAKGSPDFSSTAAWEPSHRLHETRYFDGITGEIDWCAGTCLLVNTSAFKAVGGFDETFFMYGEDVDLSFRLRANGYKLKHLSSILVSHRSRTENERPKFYTELNILANIKIRKKFLGNGAALKGCFLASLHCVVNGFAVEAPKVFLKGLITLAKTKRVPHNENLIIDSYDYGLDVPVGMPSFTPVDFDPQLHPTVSVIVRYIGENPDDLAKALVSLEQQTYQNFEVCLILKHEKAVRDDVQKLLATYDFDFNIAIYSDERGSRSTALWTGLREAKGDLIQILDYDDFLYPNHLETAVSALNSNPSASLCIQGSLEEESGPGSSILREFMPDNRIQFGEGLLNKDSHTQFNAVLDERNLMPIQSVTFRTDLLPDSDLPAIEWMEDWLLWRLVCRRGDIILNWKPSSVFMTPTGEEREKRHQDFVLYSGPADEIARDFLSRMNN